MWCFRVYKYNFFLRIAENARFVIYPSKLLGDWMESYYEPLKGKTLVIPHQICVLNTENVQLTPFFDKFNFNILHSGTLLWGRDPEGLLNGFKLFLENCPEATNEARLFFIGSKNYYSR